MTDTKDTTAELPSHERQAALLAPVRRFRKLVIRYSLFAIGIAAISAYPYSVVACKGILWGGLGGIVGFWMMARGVEKFVNITPSRVKLEVYGGTITRLLLYALVLGKAYTLDPQGMVGLLGAVGGIAVIRLVTLVLGVTRLDLRKQQPQ